eukprot:52104-Rhodomonas_salina.1
MTRALLARLRNVLARVEHRRSALASGAVSGRVRRRQIVDVAGGVTPTLVALVVGCQDRFVGRLRRHTLASGAVPCGQRPVHIARTRPARCSARRLIRPHARPRAAGVHARAERAVGPVGWQQRAIHVAWASGGAVCDLGADVGVERRADALAVGAVHSDGCVAGWVEVAGAVAGACGARLGDLRRVVVRRGAACASRAVQARVDAHRAVGKALAHRALRRILDHARRVRDVAPRHTRAVPAVRAHHRAVVQARTARAYSLCNTNTLRQVRGQRDNSRTELELRCCIESEPAMYGGRSDAVPLAEHEHVVQLPERSIQLRVSLSDADLARGYDVSACRLWHDLSYASELADL